MAERFLWWKLPHDFIPDAGISFDNTRNSHPVGTNLLTKTQAVEMVKHIVGDLLATHSQLAVEEDREQYVKSIFRSRAKTDPDMTFAEYWERHYNQKHDYRGQDERNKIKGANE